jgi:hypothetical protein
MDAVAANWIADFSGDLWSPHISDVSPDAILTVDAKASCCELRLLALIKYTFRRWPKKSERPPRVATPSTRREASGKPRIDASFVRAREVFLACTPVTMITRNQIARNLPIWTILWPEVRSPSRQLTVSPAMNPRSPPALTLVAITYILVGMIDATRAGGIAAS